MASKGKEVPLQKITKSIIQITENKGKQTDLLQADTREIRCRCTQNVAQLFYILAHMCIINLTGLILAYLLPPPPTYIKSSVCSTMILLQYETICTHGMHQYMNISTVHIMYIIIPCIT